MLRSTMRKEMSDGNVLLDQVAAMDFAQILPAHGATRADVKELAAMLADEYATVKDAVNRGASLDQALKTLTFSQYKGSRNYGRLEGEIKALYELQTGKRSYFVVREKFRSR